MVTVGCNIVLAPIFIFHFQWGMRGAGTATVISQFVGMVWILYHFMNKPRRLQVDLANLQRTPENTRSMPAAPRPADVVRFPAYLGHRSPPEAHADSHYQPGTRPHIRKDHPLLPGCAGTARTGPGKPDHHRADRPDCGNGCIKKAPYSRNKGIRGKSASEGVFTGERAKNKE